jgi:hypothetical protein
MTNNKQQTAVEWYAIEMYEYFRSMFGSGIINTDILDKAKEMEKEQIIHSYNQSWHFRDKPYETAEKYYEQTYGGGKQ